MQKTMKLNKKTWILFLSMLLSVTLLLMLVGCQLSNPNDDDTGDDTDDETKPLSVGRVVTQVDSTENIVINNAEAGETFEFTFEGENIYIDNDSATVVGLLAGTTTQVTVTSSLGRSDQFNVVVEEDTYTAGQKNDEVLYAQLFEDVNVQPINGLSKDVPIGIDVSEVYENMVHGAKYYNQDGVRQNVFYILRNSGINYVRIRLWMDPYNHNLTDSEGNYVTYGGAICDLPRVTDMAVQAKRAGLKVLLDIHYSDFWAHPGQQVLPKAWVDVKSADEMADRIYQYTTEVLQTLADAGATPDMVQLGNETRTGMLLQTPGTDSSSLTSDNPQYISGKKNISSSLSGGLGQNFAKYIAAANDAVKDFDDSILTAVHEARSFDSFGTGMFDALADVDYDIIGLSYYIYHHGTIENFKNAVTTLKNKYPDKQIAILETSYGYTDATDSNASNLFWSGKTSGERPVYDYEVSPQGQVDVLHDQLLALYEAAGDNCGGIFYWAGCWTPVAGVGWADSNTKNSWANQALFSYGGMALPSLSAFGSLAGN